MPSTIVALEAYNFLSGGGGGRNLLFLDRYPSTANDICGYTNNSHVSSANAIMKTKIRYHEIFNFFANTKPNFSV